MKLKAPEGVGAPCVGGVAVASRDGLYEVEAEIGALLIECFGFAPADAAGEGTKAPTASTASSGARRRSTPGASSTFIRIRTRKISVLRFTMAT